MLHYLTFSRLKLVKQSHSQYSLVTKTSWFIYQRVWETTSIQWTIESQWWEGWFALIGGAPFGINQLWVMLVDGHSALSLPLMNGPVNRCQCLHSFSFHHKHNSCMVELRNGCIWVINSIVNIANGQTNNPVIQVGHNCSYETSWDCLQGCLYVCKKGMWRCSQTAYGWFSIDMLAPETTNRRSSLRPGPIKFESRLKSKSKEG